MCYKKCKLQHQPITPCFHVRVAYSLVIVVYFIKVAYITFVCCVVLEMRKKDFSQLNHSTQFVLLSIFPFSFSLVLSLYPS